MNDGKVDLSALDPARNAARWEQLVRSVAARGAAGAARRRPGWLAFQLTAWLRPTLACAATVAVLAWVPTWVRQAPSAPTSTPRPTSDAAARLVAWAAGDEPDSALIVALGDDDDAR